MKRLLSAGLVVVLAWAMAAPAGALSASAKLHKKLLTVTQLPAGWLKEGTSSTEVFGCAASVFPTGPTAKAAVSFNYRAPKGFPLLTEVLGTYADSSTKFAAMTTGLNGCRTVSGTAHGSTFTGTISPTSVATYGNQTAAYVGKVLLGSTSLAVELVIVRKNNELMELEEGNNNSVSASGFLALVAKASAKL